MLSLASLPIVLLPALIAALFGFAVAAARARLRETQLVRWAEARASGEEEEVPAPPAPVAERLRAVLPAREELQQADFDRAAFKTSQVASMSVDRDFIVQSVNEATKRLFEDHEDTFRTLLPTFRAENIVGTCIDIFHRDPGRIRRLLDDPRNLPFRTTWPSVPTRWSSTSVP